MKKLLACLFASLLCTVGAASDTAYSAVDDAPAIAEDPGSCESPDTERIAEDVIEAWRASLPKTDVAAPIPCPGERTCPSTCGGITPCRKGTGGSTLDLGVKKCERSDGSEFKCTGPTTIHVVTTNCTQCPCCSAQPACLCPIDCGVDVTLTCQ